MFAENVLLFGRLLRASGLDVHHGRLLDAIRALEWIGVENRRDVAATLRSLLVHRQDDIARFDQAFDLFFRTQRSPSPGPPLFSLGERPRVVAQPVSGVPIHGELEEVCDGSRALPKAIGAWSAASVSRTKDFGDFTEAELERARRVLERLPWTLGWRRTRRWKPARTGAPHLRLLIRRNLTRGGDLVELPRRCRRDVPRPIVVLGDVSGSMERYSRMLLHLVYGLSRSQTRVEMFLFATRLTRVTRTARAGRAAAAVSRIARDVDDWAGGTRIGNALRTFNTKWARRVVRNGPLVLILSDGWDRGEPALLEREMARLSRNVHRVVWLNPLLGSAAYEPLTRGMQAALKHVDDFVPAHNLESLEALVRILGDKRLRMKDKGQRAKEGKGE